MIGNEKVLAVIPARGGSKGIIDKNITPFAGRPLIDWTIECAKNSRFVDRLVLSSEDPKIIEAALTAGCDVPFTRPKELATDHTQTIEVIVDVLNRIHGYDLVVLLQPTSPLRVPEDVDDCIEMLVKNDAPAAVSVCPAAEHPFLTYSLSHQRCLKGFLPQPKSTSLRRQDLPEAFVLNGAVYVARISWLQEKFAFISEETLGYVMPRNRSIDIDDETDLLAAEHEFLARSGKGS